MNQEQKDAIYEEYKSKLKGIEAQKEALEAKKEGLEQSAKLKYEESKQSFSETLEGIKDSGEESVDDLKTRVELAWKALKDTLSD